MTDAPDPNEGFLQRWARRKHAAQAGEQAGEQDAVQPTASPPSEAPAPVADKTAAATDLPTLPPIDQITATSDIRAFLRAGVADDVKHAALRRAWATDPAIRDFIGIAENQWNFNDPDGVPGFGSLEWTPQLRRMVGDLIGERAEQSPETESKSGEDAALTPDATSPSRAATSEGSVEWAQNGDQPRGLSDREVVGARVPRPGAVTAPSDTDTVATETSHPDGAAKAQKTRHGRALPR